MANLEQLNFEVILNDVEFNNKIGQMKQQAQDLNTTLSNLLSIKGGIAPVTDADVESAKKMNKILQDNFRLEQQMERMRSKTRRQTSVDDAAAEAAARKEVTKQREQEQREVIKTLTAQERLNRLQKENNSILGKSSRLWREVGSMAAAYFSIRGATTLIRTLTRVSAEFEMQRVTLGAILNDTQAAGKLFGQLKELAVRSPFQFKDLATYAKQLSAYSIPVNELYETTKMLADVSAGLGVGMDRLVLAYGQIRSASFLRGQEVRQLTEAGIPILVELRKQFIELGEEGITVADVFDKISKRLVPFEMVEKVFKNMTEEGGKFFEMQEVQADTLKGKISNLTDAYQIMFSEIGDKRSGLLKGAVDMARSLADNYQKVGRAIVSLVAAYGTYRAVALAVKLIEEAQLLAGINRTRTVQQLSKAIKILSAESATFAAIEKVIAGFNPWIALGAAIAAVGTYLISASVQAAKFKKELNGVADAQLRTADKAVKGFKDLVEQLRSATEGSQNYRDAISKLNNQYGEYLPNLLNEKNALKEIAKAEREVTNAIYARARAYAESEGIQKIEEKEGKKVSQATNNLLKALRGKTLAEDVADDFIKGFRDALQSSESDINTVFHDTLKNYLGDDYYRWGEESIRYWNEISGAAQEYGASVRAVSDATKEYQHVLDLRFGEQGYTSARERQYIAKVEEEYARKEAEIRNQRLSAEETEQKLLDNKKAKLTDILHRYELLNIEAKKVGKEGAWDNQIRDIKQQLADLEPGDDSWLMKLVNPVIKGNGVRDLLAQMEDGYDEYVDKIRKEYKDVTETFADAQKTYNGLVADKQRGLAVDEAVLAKAKEQYDLLEHRQKVIEDIGEALHISVNDKLRKASSGGSSGKSAEQVELEMRRDTLKDLLKWYDKLKDAGMDSQSIRNMLVAYFPDQSEIINAENYKDALIGIADALEKYDKKAAQALRDDMGLNSIDIQFEKWKKAQKAAEDYENFMNNWLDDIDLWGEDGATKVSTIVRKYSKTVEQIRKKRQEAIDKLNEKAETSQVWGLSYIEEGQKIDTKVAMEENNALLEAKASAKKAIEDIYKTWRDNNLDFNNLSDKTIAQLEKFQEAIDKFSVTNIDADDLKGLEVLKLTKEEIQKLIDEIKKGDQSKTETEISNKKINSWKYYAKNILAAADALREYAQAAGDADLEGIADAATAMGDLVKSAAEGFKQGGLIGALVGGATSILNSILKAAAEAAKLKSEFKEFMESRYLAEIDERLKSAETIFGESWLGNIRNLRTEIRGLAGDISRLTQNTYTATSASGYAKGGPPKMIEALKRYADELKLELYGKDGLLNPDTLEAIKMANPYVFSDKYESGQNLTKLIEYVKKAKELYAELENSVGQMFNSLSDDIADSLIESLKATGSAVTDLEGVFQGLGDAIFKSMVQSFVIDEVLNKYKNEVMSWWTDETLTEADIATRIRDFAESVKQDIDIADDRITAMYNAFMQHDLLSMSEEAKDNSLSGGVKSITEDTANLLASYVNGIRADVAAIRQAIAAGNTNTLPSPTLAEYLTQIQANTYNNAVAAQAILENLQSMMTVTDGPALRVFM